MSRISDSLFLAAVGGIVLYTGTIGVGLIGHLIGGSTAAPSALTTSAPDEAGSVTSPEVAVASIATEKSAATQLTAVAAGEKLFNKCKSCHSIGDDGKSGTGPNLLHVYGRAPGALDTFKYSDAFKNITAATWDAGSLDAFLENPKGFAPGTKMAFPGLKSADDRASVIAFLADKAGVRLTAADSPAQVDVADDGAAPAEDIKQTPYVDPPEPSDAELAAEKNAVAALKAQVETMDYQRARYHPIHFKGAIEKATNGECLVCHEEILAANVRETSPAGVKAKDSLAWYQTLATFDGGQQTFHQRHMTSPYAQSVMKLNCNFCHKGNDPREESPLMQPGMATFSGDAEKTFAARKMVNPSETCLLCHGQMPDPVNIMGLTGPFHEVRADLESPDQPNACLSCHAEAFRTNRHNVNYLKAATIEDLAKEGSDVCYGCHGGRAWYRISYPYARHPWPGMDPAVPDWAKDRPTESKPEYRMPAAQ
jgi:cytochrome c2